MIERLDTLIAKVFEASVDCGGTLSVEHQPTHIVWPAHITIHSIRARIVVMVKSQLKHISKLGGSLVFLGRNFNPDVSMILYPIHTPAK